jgi:hypothetical protein
MTSVGTEAFWELYRALPEDARVLAVKNYRLWRDNPGHPSLRFKSIKEELWSVRIGLHYRALGRLRGDEMTWVWIGHHSEYDRLI